MNQENSSINRLLLELDGDYNNYVKKHGAKKTLEEVKNGSLTTNNKEYLKYLKILKSYLINSVILSFFAILIVIETSLSVDPDEMRIYYGVIGIWVILLYVLFISTNLINLAKDPFDLPKFSNLIPLLLTLGFLALEFVVFFMIGDDFYRENKILKYLDLISNGILILSYISYPMLLSSVSRKRRKVQGIFQLRAKIIKKLELEVTNQRYIIEIKQKVLELGSKYPRLEVREIAEVTNISDQNLIIKVLTKMIVAKEIHAQYFKSSNSVAFDQKANLNELDQLDSLFENWADEEISEQAKKT